MVNRAMSSAGGYSIPRQCFITCSCYCSSALVHQVPHFSACKIENVGVAWRRGYWTCTCTYLHRCHNYCFNWEMYFLDSMYMYMWYIVVVIPMIIKYKLCTCIAVHMHVPVHCRNCILNVVIILNYRVLVYRFRPWWNSFITTALRGN